MKITALLVEDHTVVREGLRELLNSESDIEVVGEAANGREAVDMTLKLQPDVVIMDIAMPLLNGMEATRQILHAVPGTKIIILSAHNDDAYVERMNELGAAGYLTKQTSSQFLAEAIREVEKGNTYFSQEVARRFTKQHKKTLTRNGMLKAKKTCLSPREMEVLQQIAEGRANKQIASELDISIKTVEKHRTQLMQKLDIHDTASLTRYAISEGIIEGNVKLTIIE